MSRRPPLCPVLAGLLVVSAFACSESGAGEGDAPRAGSSSGAGSGGGDDAHDASAAGTAGDAGASSGSGGSAGSAGRAGTGGSGGGAGAKPSDDRDASVSGDASADADADTGTQEDPLPTGEPVIVGVGSWGLRTRSFGGADWNVCGNPSTGNDHSPDLLRNVAFGAGVFIAVGGDANSMVMRSPDGVHWEEDLHPTDACPGEPYPASCTSWMGGVAYGDGVFVAGGGNGALMRSLDEGRSFSGLHPSTRPAPVRDIAFGNGRFVAGTDDGALYVSDDAGESWTAVPLWSHSMRVRFGGGRFLAFGEYWTGSGFDRACFVGDAQASNFVPCGATVAAATSFVHDGTQWIAALDDATLATSENGTVWSTREVQNAPSQLLFDGDNVIGERNGRVFRMTSPESFELVAMDVPGVRAWSAGRIALESVPDDAGPACEDLR